MSRNHPQDTGAATGAATGTAQEAHDTTPTTTLPTDRQPHGTARRRTCTHHRQGVREGRLAVEERAPSLGSLHLREKGEERRRFSRGHATSTKRQRGSEEKRTTALLDGKRAATLLARGASALRRDLIQSDAIADLRPKRGGGGEREDRGPTRQPRTGSNRRPTRSPAHPTPALPNASPHLFTPYLAHGGWDARWLPQVFLRRKTSVCSF